MLECPICYEDYDNKQSKIFLECGHHMCSSCLLEFYKRNKECGFCRKEFKVADITYLYMLKYSIIKKKDNLFKFIIFTSDNLNTILKIKDDGGKTVFHYACLINNKIPELIKMEINPFITDNNGRNPFYYLSETSHFYPMVKDYMEKYKLKIHRFYLLCGIIIYLSLKLNITIIYFILLMVFLVNLNNSHIVINKFKFKRKLTDFKKEVLTGVIPDKNTIKMIKKLELEDHLSFLRLAGYIE